MPLVLERTDSEGQHSHTARDRDHATCAGTHLQVLCPRGAHGLRAQVHECVISKREEGPGASRMWESRTGCSGVVMSPLNLQGERERATEGRRRRPSRLGTCVCAEAAADVDLHLRGLFVDGPLPTVSTRFSTPPPLPPPRPWPIWWGHKDPAVGQLGRKTGKGKF